MDGPGSDVLQLEGNRTPNNIADNFIWIERIGIHAHQVEEPQVRRLQRTDDGEMRQIIIQDVVMERLLEGEGGPQRRRAEDAAESLLYVRQAMQADPQLLADRASAAVAARQILRGNFPALSAGRVHDLRLHFAGLLFEAFELPAEPEINGRHVPRFRAQNGFQERLGYAQSSFGAEAIAAIGRRSVAQGGDQLAR